MHYRCLQFYLAHGLILDKIHRVIAFCQRKLMLPFLKFCNDGRKNAQSDFKSSLYKLIANAFYGKTVENVCKCANIRLIADLTKFVRSVSKAIGCAILEFAKLLMYEFYYDCLILTFGDRLRLCYTDTDSFVCYVENEDLAVSYTHLTLPTILRV